MKSNPTIVFMGTPDFAVPTLQALHQENFSIKLVVTQPDKLRGRGRLPAAPPVKLAATALGLAVAQPLTVRNEAFITMLDEIKPDLLVVVAFGQILPPSVLSCPRQGAVNVHASLLPKYRGPAPIQWAILRGEKQTGVTTILMDLGVDTGDILLSAATAVLPEDTAATLHNRLAHLGAGLLVQTLDRLVEGALFPCAQKHAEATYAPLLKKEDGRIRWEQSSEALDAHIRAMTPWPGAFCFHEGRRYRILRSQPLPDPHDQQPGTVLPGFPDELRIAAGQGTLSILEIQAASGKPMPISTFLHGHPLTPGTVFI